MTTATSTGAHPPTTRSASRVDWYAVRVAAPEPVDPGRSFIDLATLLAAPMTPARRPQVDAALVVLATAADASHLAPTRHDPDSVLHRLAARLLAWFVHHPDDPAIERARQVLHQAHGDR